MIAITGFALRFDRRGSRAEVAALRAEVQSLFDENPDAITVCNREGFVLRTNRARCELLGVTLAESIGYHLGCSVGISMFPAHGKDVETLLNHAPW